MHSKVRRMWIAANDTHPRTVTPTRPARRQAFPVEIGLRVAHASPDPSDAHPASAPETAWFVTREPHWVDAQLWRVHAILDRLLR
jgi:hypothetical protein